MHIKYVLTKKDSNMEKTMTNADHCLIKIQQCGSALIKKERDIGMVINNTSRKCHNLK